jgi:hypothetical protein
MFFQLETKCTPMVEQEEFADLYRSNQKHLLKCLLWIRVQIRNCLKGAEYFRGDKIA